MKDRSSNVSSAVVRSSTDVPANICQVIPRNRIPIPDFNRYLWGRCLNMEPIRDILGMVVFIAGIIIIDLFAPLASRVDLYSIRPVRLTF